ncbi:MAG: ribokinase [Candidatus Actinomarina sp.]|jgi:ribokinase|nr:ribokinase [Candidatus Actinomarina sp.]|tara:strand:+ start:1436 stop:2302 length:867 start_codon:yes stop_codon:yes gene_type:complete
MNSKICVIGSSNIDQIAYTQNIPADGETLFGDSFQMGFGGKGANQAVMAGLLGADVYMITCLGDDVYKEMTITNYQANNVNTDHIQMVRGSSGVAPIWVDSTGQNRIIVIPGANNEIDATKAISSMEEIRDIAVLVGQCEIPMDVNHEVFKYARSNSIITIFNPAPATTLDKEFLNHISWLIPNENEFKLISGMEPNNENFMKFKKEVPCNLIVTLGEKGAVLVEEDGTKYFEAPTVEAVDTTGAGDSFIGTFAYELSEENSPEECIKKAVAKASQSVTKKGTQSSYS